MRRILSRRVPSHLSVTSSALLARRVAAPATAAETAPSFAASYALNDSHIHHHQQQQVRECATVTAVGEAAPISSSAVAAADEATFLAALRHVIAELPTAGLRLADLDDRLQCILGSSGGADPSRYGFATILEALAAVNETHYLVDDFVVPCDWEQIIAAVREKLPPGGVLEPAFVRYINAAGCPRFKRGSPMPTPSAATAEGTEGAAASSSSGVGSGRRGGPTQKELAIQRSQALLREANPTGSSLPGVTIAEWAQAHFARLIEVVDATPQSVLDRAAAHGIANPQRTFVYKPVEEAHPFVGVLNAAFRCLGVPTPHHMPVAVPLQAIASIVPLLPANPKTGAAYTWADFLRLPEIKERFETKVEIFVGEQRAAQRQIIFVDGTTLQPDEAEAAVHQWRARRQQDVGDDAPVECAVVVIRREEDAPHTRDDIIIDGHVVEPSHAIIARLALVADTGRLEAEAHQDIGGHGKGGEDAEAATITKTKKAADATADGWSAVTEGSSSTAPSSASSSTASSSLNASESILAKALSSPDDETEHSLAAEAAALAAGVSPTDAAAAATATTAGDSTEKEAAAAAADGGAAADILSVAGSLIAPTMPHGVAQDVIVLVGSRDSKSLIDAELAEINANRHWVRTLLVIGEA